MNRIEQVEEEQLDEERVAAIKELEKDKLASR